MNIAKKDELVDRGVSGGTLKISAKSQNSTNLSKFSWLYPKLQQDCHSTYFHVVDSYFIRKLANVSRCNWGE